MAEEIHQDEMQEVLEEFILETEEILDNLDQNFVELEKSPENIGLINEIFRSMHTIKGASGFLGLNQMVEVAHQAENVLNILRQEKLKVTPAIMDTLLKSADLIKELLDIIKNNESREIDLSEILSELNQIIEGKPLEEKKETKPKEEKTEVKTEPKKAGKAETKPKEKTKPKKEKKGRKAKKDEKAEKKAEEMVLEKKPEEKDEQPVEEVKEDKVISEEKKDKPLGIKDKISQELKVDKTIRVDIDRLDSLMNLVGELVLDRNRLINIDNKLEEKYEEDLEIKALGDLSAHVNRVTTDLQLAVMKTRMQPIKKVFSKFPRMVRDMARDVGKEINLEVLGEETELDKSVIEEIGDPLVHLIRNAVDHGIESPEERENAGKPRMGNIKLSASYEGNNIMIEIEDNGKGMDVERIKEKAIEKGIIDKTEAERLSEKECLNLIFTPGFSTAQKISDISGRGVGMDVVKTNITKLNGIINIDTELGKGSKIAIKLPLTVAIINALMVGVENEMFAIPIVSVIETIKISPESIRTIDRHEVVNIRDSVLPLIRLSDEFNIQLSGDKESFYVVVVGIAEKRYGIVVEELCGQEEIVIKSMGDFLSDSQGIAGATITGDGKVILILDIAMLVQNLKVIR